MSSVLASIKGGEELLASKGPTSVAAGAVTMLIDHGIRCSNGRLTDRDQISWRSIQSSTHNRSQVELHNVIPKNARLIWEITYLSSR